LDEPHAGLDASARDTLDRLIGDAGAAGVTVLIASHETEFVESLAARAVTVTGGRITGARSIGAPSLGAPSLGLPPAGGLTGGPTDGLDALPGPGPGSPGVAGPIAGPTAGRPAGEVAHVA
jgi:energy-coupling factor transporter ATP-binding protein EcfA2